MRNKIAFSIQKEPSTLHKTVAITLFWIHELKEILSVQEKIGPLAFGQLPSDPLLALLIKEEEAIRIKEGKKNRFDTVPPYFRIRNSSALTLLQHLAASRKLYFETKPLICDFFNKLQVRFHVDKKEEALAIHPELYSLATSFKVDECDLMCPAAGGVAVFRSMLLFFDETVSVKELLPFAQGPRMLSAEEFSKWHKEQDPLTVQFHYALQPPQQPVDPLPILKFEDRTGALAHLLVDYGGNTILPFAETGELHPLQKFLRNYAAEKGLEKDLLECGYVKKHSSYYCPVINIAKTTELLLGIGWKVIDFQGKEVVPLTKIELTSRLCQENIEISGKVFFNDTALDAHTVLRAVKEQKVFLSLGDTCVGLLTNEHALAGLQTLLQEIEVVGNTLTTPKNRIGLLHEHTTQKLQLLIDDDALRTLYTQAKEAIPQTTLQNSFHGTLRPYQQHGVNWLHFLYTQGFSGILADDMGLGKTVQILAFLSTISPLCKVLIVAPTSLIFQWEKEIQKFLPDMSYHVYHGKDRKQEGITLFSSGIILSSYGIVRQEPAIFHTTHFDCLIVDEAQTIKNHDTQTFKAMSSIPSSFRLSVTGTPIENSLLELWTQFAFLQSTLLGPKEPFLQPLAQDTLKGIRKKIEPFFLRRTKQSVAPELPEKIEQTIFVTMSDEQRAIYDSFMASLQQGLVKKITHNGINACRMEVFEAILRLRQIACHPLLISAICEELGAKSLVSAKADLVLEDLATIIAEGKKVLLFSQFASMLQLLAKEARAKGWNYVLLDGDTQDREAIVHTFQNDESTPILFASLKAGGIGLNLTRADYVLLFDPWWNRAQEMQAIDRAHRIGRKSTVVCKRYIVKDSIEEKILLLQEQKQQIVDHIFKESQPTALCEEDLALLISPIYNSL